MLRSRVKLSLLIVCLTFLLHLPHPVQAQWPPIRYSLNGEYNEKNNTITYYIQFSEQVDWLMTNVSIKIPLPEGTKLVDTFTYPIGEFKFDGSEITYFMAVAKRVRHGDAFFVVEITDPEKTVFSSRAWISWSGNEPGDYLSETLSFDIHNMPPLEVDSSGTRRLDLQMSAEVNANSNLVTYTIFFRNEGETDSVRMQDVRISVPLPPGTEFISANAPPDISTSFDGEEVSFFILEIPRHTDMGNLQIQISTAGVEDQYITTHSWATWKNAGRRVVTLIPAEEDLLTSDLTVRPHVNEWVFSDPTSDVPYSTYDVKNLVLQQQQDGLNVLFYTVDPLTSIDRFYEFVVYVDSDCDRSTGEYNFGRGAEYFVMYKYLYSPDHQSVLVRQWNSSTRLWEKMEDNAKASMNLNTVSMTLPNEVLVNNRFCWVTEVGDKTKDLPKRLPVDNILGEINLSDQPLSASSENSSNIDSNSNIETGAFIGSDSIWRFLPGWSEPPLNWNSVEFNDSDWFSGKASIGYGLKDITTDISLLAPPLTEDVASLVVQKAVTQTGIVLAILPSVNNQAVYMRQSFELPNAAQLTHLNLDIKYVGGFVAYLNGTEIARQNLGESGIPISATGLANSETTKVTQETISLTDLSTLVSGTNILAIEGHQPSNAERLLLDPKLTWDFDPLVLNAADTRYLPENLAVTTAPIAPTGTTEITGKLAVPIDNGQANYDIFVFSLPDGELVKKLPYARQPNFHPSGQRLLINREGDGVENVFEYNFETDLESKVSDSPGDGYPVYDPGGNRVAYANDQLAVSGIPVPKTENGEVDRHNKTGDIIYKGNYAPFIFLQCSLNPPHLEQDAHCRDIAVFGVLIPAGQMGDLQGTHPFWTFNDLIVFKGCNSWAGGRLCGIFTVPSSSTKALGNGFIPKQLTRDTSDTPSDTKGNFIAFTSQRDGDWEAYIMDLNGNGLQNLSNSPGSNDGLPTISPDQQWIAFVSDRGGQWAVWVVPSGGGTPQKLFDLPTNNPWGDNDRSWLTERISWGP